MPDFTLANSYNYATNQYCVGDTSQVGSYLAGASTYGIQDLSGNVWEWPRSLVGDYPYPSLGKSRNQREKLDATSDQ